MNNSKAILNNYLLADGFDLDLDLVNSNGSIIRDEGSSASFIDFFTCFASMPVGFNHPALKNEKFIREIGEISLNKPSNSDIYTSVYADFVKTFFNIAVSKHFKYSFFIEGGTLAVENALKVAFDWKVKKNFKKGYTFEKGYKVLHFKQAFHGRSGYTLSLTNTDPVKTNLFPKFDWPRVMNPKMTFPNNTENIEKVIADEEESLRQIKQAFVENFDDIASIIIEPIQGEGGDNHFRPEFLAQLRQVANENEALLIFDEVQTGVGLTGEMWAHEAIGVMPDIMTFGKKMQVCGIIVSDRVDEIPNNVFHESSRINSTWGGNLTDMHRCKKYLEIIKEENLLQNVRDLAPKLNTLLNNLVMSYPEFISNPRNRGLFGAFDVLPSIRKNLINEMYNNGLIMLGSGEKSIRFRPALNLSEEMLTKGFEIINHSVKSAIDKSSKVA